MFKKLSKFLLCCTFISGIAFLLYTLYQNNFQTDDDASEEITSKETESCDLDQDLEPLTKREYVPLNKNTPQEVSSESSDDSAEETDH